MVPPTGDAGRLTSTSQEEAGGRERSPQAVGIPLPQPRHHAGPAVPGSVLGNSACVISSLNPYDGPVTTGRSSSPSPITQMRIEAQKTATGQQGA